MTPLAAIELSMTIVEAIIKIAPSVEQGIVSSLPYAQAIAGLIQGTNATQEQINNLLATVNIASGEFQRPLPVDDGTTTG